MEITLITVGKTGISFVKQGIEEYLKRLKRYIGYQIIELPDVKKGKNFTAEQQKGSEGELIMSKITPSDMVVLLDERGKQFTSMEFSAELQRRMASGIKRLVYVVGGPYGFDEKVYRRADALLSLSKMTFNHEMVRLFFTEQVYRAMTILRNEPYHHE